MSVGYDKHSELEELETPIRYRPDSLSALCRTTRFSEAEIKRIYRGFKAECPTGVVREDTFKLIYSQFFPQGVKSYLHNVTHHLRESLAISLRLDGSTDSMQEHNIYTMAQVVNKDAAVSPVFLGFGTPKKDDGPHYLQCIKTVPNAIIQWEELFSFGES
ncbi:Calsenilin [Pseudolycoriella hygida]|uniref:Calsenilin n=1 Tax=Pseudolycoriella hygida TaxID=35572 RepID=A0A9Q0S0E2_9DIPT|nr:Calsenilin [Pseudolycoriella hygida]